MDTHAGQMLTSGSIVVKRAHVTSGPPGSRVVSEYVDFSPTAEFAEVIRYISGGQ